MVFRKTGELFNTALRNYLHSFYSEIPTGQLLGIYTNDDYFRITEGAYAQIYGYGNKTTLFINEYTVIEHALTMSGTELEDEEGFYDVINGELIAFIPNGWSFVNDNDHRPSFKYVDKRGI